MLRRTANHAPEARVYFLRGGRRGLIKIGVAVNLPRRLRALRTASPDPVEILASIPGGFETERLAHYLVSRYRQFGEWFGPAPEVLRLVDTARLVNRLTDHDPDLGREIFADTLRMTVES
jgi:T5orf172 domain